MYLKELQLEPLPSCSHSHVGIIHELQLLPPGTEGIAHLSCFSVNRNIFIVIRVIFITA